MSDMKPSVLFLLFVPFPCDDDGGGCDESSRESKSVEDDDPLPPPLPPPQYAVNEVGGNGNVMNASPSD